MIIIKSFSMILSWKESVALIIIDILKDPSLVQYFMKLLMPLRRDYLDDEARIYRINLAKTTKLSLDYAKRIDNLHKSIRYLKNGVITRIKVIPYDLERYEQTSNDKVNIINLIFGDSYESYLFRNKFTIKDLNREILDLENKLVVYDIYDEETPLSLHIFDKDHVLPEFF